MTAFGKWLVNDVDTGSVIRKTSHAGSDLNIDVIVNDDPNKLRFPDSCAITVVPFTNSHPW